LKTVFKYLALAVLCTSLMPSLSGVVIAYLQVYVLLEQIYTHLGEMELARKYAQLSGLTPTPVQSDFDRTH
jgi:hypothetical protein